MAKIKLKLDEPMFLEMDGTPEELASFVKILREQNYTKKPIDLKREEVEEKQALVEREKSELKSAISEAQLKSMPTEATAPVTEIPSVEEVIMYLTSKKDFEHHTKELQEKYLGGGIKSRSNPVLYGAFDRVLRNARDIIAKQYGVMWDTSETRNLGGRTNVTIYKLIKPNEGSNTPQINEDSQTRPPFQKILPIQYRKIEPNMYQ